MKVAIDPPADGVAVVGIVSASSQTVHRQLPESGGLWSCRTQHSSRPITSSDVGAARFLGLGAELEPLERDEWEGWYHAPPLMAAPWAAIGPGAPRSILFTAWPVVQVVLLFSRCGSRAGIRPT